MMSDESSLGDLLEQYFGRNDIDVLGSTRNRLSPLEVAHAASHYNLDLIFRLYSVSVAITGAQRRTTQTNDETPTEIETPTKKPTRTAINKTANAISNNPLVAMNLCLKCLRQTILS